MCIALVNLSRGKFFFSFIQDFTYLMYILGFNFCIRKLFIWWVFLCRLSLSNDTYTIIKSPICNWDVHSFIGKSKGGVYFAAIDRKAYLRVWILSETADKRTAEWLLKHQSALDPHAWWRSTRIKGDRQNSTSPGPWIMDICHNGMRKKAAYDYDDCLDWDSDDDYILDIPNNEEEREEEEDDEDWDHGAEIDFLGFHPYKEVIFLGSGPTVAYHWNSGKVQHLGEAYPRTYNRGFFESFVYTPCLIGD